MLTIQLHYPPSYVLDEMQFYEINAALQYSYYSSKDNWEQARLIAYMIAQTNSKKKLKFEDIATFPWEKEQEESEHETKITKADIERLNQMAKSYLESTKQQNK